jgi:2-polyprenyl-3-methyl-5-hydroxy-6-metoxy-1,4-benzoquinol methylase
MSTYVYPDQDDATTVTFIEKEKSWEHDEMEVFTHAKRLIRPGGILVDAGCGFGRLIPVFADSFEKIIAIEPDSNRIEKAKSTVAVANLLDKVDFINLLIQEVVLEQKVDVVLSSHIIQHISTTAVPVVVQKMSDMLKPDGILILTTNHSPRDEDKFTKGYLHNGENIEDIITKNQFEDLIGNMSGVIPVHMYSPESLSQLLGHAGLDVIEQHLFHPGPHYPEGRDVLVVAKKR